jgi:hypothetical protein
MRLRPIHETTVYLVKICIVLHEMGLPITSAMVCAIKGNSINAAVSTLHTLGDKHIINLVRTGGTNARKTEMLRWNLSETFKGMYYPPITKGG